MSTAITVPRGLNGVEVTETSIGHVLGDIGVYHYRGRPAASLARDHDVSFEAACALVLDGVDAGEMARAAGTMTSALAAARADAALAVSSGALASTIAAITERINGAVGLNHLGAAVALFGAERGMRPMLDATEQQRRADAIAIIGALPVLVAALAGHDVSAMIDGAPPSRHAQAYLAALVEREPAAADVRALEEYLILTIDHGFNASTFTGRVVASTGADLAAVVSAAMAALSGPLHGGAPSRALDALDAIGSPERARQWVIDEIAAGRRVMGFGHAVYRTTDPRSTHLKQLARRIGGEQAAKAIAIETAITETLAELKPDNKLYANVEFYAGVVMAACGVPRALFTATFAVSRVVGWCAHALEQGREAKLIRPSARYVGPPLLDD